MPRSALLIAIALVLLATLYCKGRLDGARKPNALLLQQSLLAHAQQDHYDEIARQLARSQASQANYSTLLGRAAQQVVVHPLYRNVCLDADGLRVANDALTNRATNAAATLPTLNTPR